MTVAIPAEVEKEVNLQAHKVHQCAAYFFQGGAISGFDSIQDENRPDDLQAIFDNIGDNYSEKIDNAVRLGIETYKVRNGGELPHASVVAAALSAGAKASTGAVQGFDDISNQQFEQAAIVPAMTVVTIASVIANALPVIALLPNANNSTRIPVVSVRYQADTIFGALTDTDYLDGEKAALPYSEGRFRFALSNSAGVDYEYTVVAHNAYADYKAKTPLTSAPVLPFLSGNVSLRVNGKEVAHTRADRNLSITKGAISANIIKRVISIASADYVLNDVQVNLDTSTVTATFDKALPANAVVEVYLVANFDAKDASKNHIIKPVGVQIEPQYEEIQAVPYVNQINVSYNTQNQLATELGIGFAGSALLTLQGKLFLEQNVRLLTEGKERAIMNGRVEDFDFTRGATGNFSTAINTTGELVAEVFKYIEYSKLKIRQATGGSTTKFDLYVGDKGAVFFNCLAGDKFKKTGVTASYGEIVRIGTLSDGTDVYHTPTTQGVVNENDTSVELLTVGRGSEPVRNPMVGSIVEPPVIREAKPDTRDVQFGLHGKMAAELNPLERYADQFAVVNMFNLPVMGLNH